ncbi:MAG: GNAT family N-acetyltransferase, partial [Longicatena sp.]
MRNNIVLEIAEEDIEDLCIILEESFKKNLEFEKFKKQYQLTKEDKNIKILGYYKNDVLVGTLSYHILVMPNGREMTLWNLAVKEAYRNQRIATQLMEEAETIARRDKE